MSENLNNDVLDDVEERLTAHEENSDIHVSASEKSNWNGKAEGDHNHNKLYAPLSKSDTYFKAMDELILSNHKTVLLRNLILNGSFENSLTGWHKIQNCDFAIEENDSAYGTRCFKIFPVDSTQSEAFALYNVAYQTNHKYYITVMSKCDPGATAELFFGSTTGFVSALSENTEWTPMSLYVDFKGQQEGTYVRLDCNNLWQNRACYFDGICMVDLTTAFGIGMEPNKEWCDQYISYFEKSLSITYPNVNQYKLENLVKNGSYEDGMEYWNQMVGNLGLTNEISRNGIISARVISTDGNNAYYQRIRLTAGHQYYASGYFYLSSVGNQSNNIIDLTVANIDNWTELHHQTLFTPDLELNQWIQLSFVFSPNETIAYGFYPNLSGEISGYIDGLMLLDLTSQFGAGNEPSQEWCDKNIPFFEKELNYFYPNLTGSVVKNLVQNGSFEDGLNGWEINGETVYSVSTDDAADGVFSILKEQAMEESTYLKQTLEWKAGHKYYYTAQAETFDEIVYFSINVDDGSSMFSIRKTGEQFVKGSKIYSCRTDQSQWLMVGYNTNYYAMFLDAVMVIDLTESFGAGNEPTKEWCDLHIPYFEGTMLL